MGAEKFLHYRILEPLGQGGMGEVFLADDERLGRRVALKFLPAAAAASPEASERLRREARSLAALSHPNIATIYALETEGNRSCLVMEYVEGETLGAKIARRPLPSHEAVSFGISMAEALAHAHSKRIIHRDVKPANILVTPQGVAKLTDFGIAHLEGATTLTAKEHRPGTVAYMSPEQARGTPLDGRSDIFSLGAVLYEALTGVRAFAADRPEAALYAILSLEPQPPSALRRGIPPGLERIVVTCMKKDPGQRYQRADQLAADLTTVQQQPDRVTGGEPTTTQPATEALPARSRLITRLATAGGVVAIAAAVYIFGPFHPGAPPQPPAAEAAEKSIAVLSFENLEEPADPHGSAPIATSLLTVGLGESQVMPVLSAQRVHDVLRQIGKPNEIVKGVEALQVAKRAGAAYVVTGFIYATRPEVVLAAEVASISDGTVLTASKVRTAGGDHGLFAAVDSLTTALRDGLARAGFGVRESAVDVAGLTTRNPVAYRSYVRGLDQLYRSRWSDAERFFQSAIAADSTFALAWYYAAVSRWWNSDIKGAQREVKTALRLGSRLSRRDRDALGALGALVAADYDRAARQYRALLARYRDDKEFLYGLGEALYHGGVDEPGALRALEQATEVDPAFGVAYSHLVDLRVRQRAYPAALVSAERLARADPDNSQAYLKKGSVLFLMGDAKGGIRACREALARDPQSVEAMSTIGTVQGRMGDFDSMRVAITPIAATGRPDAKLGLGLNEVFLLLIQGRFREGEALAAELERADGSERTISELVPRWLRAIALMELGRREEGIREMETYGRGIDRVVSIRCGGLAKTIEFLIEAGRLEEAEARLRHCDRLLSQSTNWMDRPTREFAAGLVALARGRSREAIAIFEKNAPGAPATDREWIRRWTLSRALLAAGDKDRALIELEWVVSRVPGCGDPINSYKAMIALARLYETRGRRSDALTLYARVTWQYRMAEPGVKAKDEALDGIQRLSKRPS